MKIYISLKKEKKVFLLLFFYYCMSEKDGMLQNLHGRKLLRVYKIKKREVKKNSYVASNCGNIKLKEII